MKKLKERPALLSFLSVAVLVVTLCRIFVLRWEQNDDICMSMVAHGYGLAAQSSPNLLFSNVLWGHLVRAIPTIHGVLGYSLATMAVLLLAGWALLYFLLRLGAGYLPSLLAVTLVLARPIFFPQFTLNAGLLTVAAVIGWRVHARFGGVGSVLAACLLAFFGYLIRSEEFFLVLIVALPLLPWRSLWRQRSMQISLMALMLAVASAAALDQKAYSGPEWKFFKELDAARLPFADYNAGEYLKRRPDILVRHGYSKNDIDLIGSKFYVDKALANPKALNAMMAELGPLATQKERLVAGWEAFKEFVSHALLPLLLAGLFLLGILPRRSIVLAWAICFAILFAIGVLFRPGVMHVYFPLMSLLLLAPLWGGAAEGVLRKWITVAVLLAACAGNIYVLVSQSVFSQRVMERAQKDALFFPQETLFSWGATLPVSLLFPVLSQDPRPRAIRWYAMNSFTYAPYSVAMADQKAGRGLLDLWRTEKGIPIIQSVWTPRLANYCAEHCNGQLQGAPVRRMPIVTVQQMRCVPNP